MAERCSLPLALVPCTDTAILALKAMGFPYRQMGYRVGVSVVFPEPNFCPPALTLLYAEGDTRSVRELHIVCSQIKKPLL